MASQRTEAEPLAAVENVPSDRLGLAGLPLPRLRKAVVVDAINVLYKMDRIDVTSLIPNIPRCKAWYE